MKYLINHSVLFDTAGYQLGLLNNNASVIKLSNTAGRVLEALIAAHGEGNTVTREWLFDSVWVKYGMQPSNGNLNQQISLLRKALISLHLDATAIVTLPKRGLKLNDRLLITQEENPPQPPAASLPQPQDREDGQPDGAFTAEKSSSTKEIFINGVLGIAFAATLLMAYVYFNRQDRQPLFLLDKVDSCDIYTLRPVPARDKESMLEQLRQVMRGNIEKCTAHHFILFSHNIVTNTTIRSGINQRNFMAKCERDAQGNIASCLNFYFYNWDAQ
ncbi:winged helix-turn-helix domain-containing protein [Sodalis ligni]|uniref:DNA-binding winged helix-turn-helix (WHTH) protein n=1 Tax=Sodalis ligni TaxID=2697027 RepID=A0A4R1N7E3_9GAMM|nr:hypothetical protein [Sodalis ligni]TCL03093.1 DNA-binding winged helix-turn-helix (wHTH) protein [Sodalis ligni]